MKRTRILVAINAFQVFFLIVSVVVTLIIMPDILIFDKSESIPATYVMGTEADAHNGYADVTLYGAVPDDGKDDTKAFEGAAGTGAGVYVPLGTFEIEKTVNLKGQSLKGAGANRSVILCNSDCTILMLSGAVTVDDITLSYSKSVINGNEKSGEKIAVCDNGITYGSMLRAVKISCAGTGYYSHRDFSSDSAITIESVEIDDFSYKAIDIENSVATLIRSANINNAQSNAASCVSLGGSCTVESLILSDIRCQYLLELINADSAVVKTLLFNNTTAESGCLIRCSSAMFSMQTVTLKETSAASVFKIDDEAESVQSSGNLISLCSDSGSIAIDEDNIIRCENQVLQ